MSNDLVMALTSMLSLSHGDSTPSVQLFRAVVLQILISGMIVTIRTGVEDALTKWKDSIKE